MVHHIPDFHFLWHYYDSVKIVVSLTAVKVKIKKTIYKQTSRSSNSTPGHMSEKTKALIREDTCNPKFTAATFTPTHTHCKKIT